jgi:hypothetical protein
MTKGIRPPTYKRPDRPRPLPDDITGGGPGGPLVPLDPCAAEAVMSAIFEVTVSVGEAVIASPIGSQVVLMSQLDGRRVGIVPPPDDAKVRDCASHRWIYEGTVIEPTASGLVSLHGIRR